MATGRKNYIPGTPSDTEEDLKTSTPFLNSRRKMYPDFDVSTIEPDRSGSPILNETLVRGAASKAVPQKVRAEKSKPNNYRRVQVISSSEDESDEDDASVQTVLGTPSSSEEKSFQTACEAANDSPKSRRRSDDKTSKQVKGSSRDLFQRKSKTETLGSDDSWSLNDSPRESPNTASAHRLHSEKTVPVDDLAEQVSQIGLGDVVPGGSRDEVVNLDDLADQFEEASIHRRANKLKPTIPSPSSSPEIVEVRVGAPRISPVPVRVPPPAPKLERKLPQAPAPRKMIFLPDVPVPTSSAPDNLPEHLKGTVGELILKLQRVISSIPKDDGIDELGEPESLKVTLHKHQKYALKWMWWREHKKPYGGILADEMGLGKTVMVLALVCRGKTEGVKENNGASDWQMKDTYRLVPSRTTLVVCPPSVLGQWEEEVRQKCRGLKVLKYHGPNRVKSSAFLAQHDIVLTTYTTLSAEIPKLSEQTAEACRSPVIRVHWERIVLDEGHQIRNSKTAGSQAVCRLAAQRRWVVTGTPVHNKPADMHALVKFLRLEPFDDPKVWESWIGMKLVSAQSAERLNTISKCLLLRRTKDEVAVGDDSGVSTIPPKTIIDKFVELTQEERDIYDHLDSFATKEFRAFLKAKDIRNEEMQKAANQFIAGRARPLKQSEEKSYTHIFTLILRLRQCAVLPILIKSMVDDDDDLDYSAEYDPIEDMVSLKNPIFSEDFKSAKLHQMYEDLDTIKRECKARGERMEKVVIVSQWTSLLTIVERHVTLKGYSTTTISGEIKIGDRTDIMMKFNNDPKRPQIMLLSLQAGGVGLNLIGANHLFFLDIHWNPQLELQAQDRIHRFGQKKPVTIHRYISQGTIEERVVELQKCKLDLADGILNSAQRKTGAGLNIGAMKKLFGV